MKDPQKTMKILKGLLFILVPWLFLYIVELPFYKWYWYFGLHKLSLLAYIMPLLIYIPLAILGFIVGLLTYPFYQIILKSTKKIGFGFGFANWNFAMNIAIVVFILITNRVALAFKSSSGLDNAAWLYIIIGLILSFVITGAIFYPVAKRSKERVVAPFKLRNLLLIGIGLFLLSIAFSSSRVTSAKRHLKDKPNILLITLDTANINYFPGYGSPDLVAPRIAQFVDESVLFTNAYVSTPLTTPSHGSIFTGAYPQYHKAYSNESKLPFRVKTISEYFKNKGYVTGGFPSAFCVTSLNNFNQGFDYFANRQISDDLQTTIYSYIAPVRFLETVCGYEIAQPEMPINSNAKLTNSHFLRWMKKNQGRRWFAWLHYFDLHAPYLPPSMADIPRAQQMGNVETSLMSASVKSLTCLFGSRYFINEKISSEELTDDDVSYIRNLYREEIKHVDEAFGDVMAQLKELDILDNTIIALIGDHGEGLYERGYFGHNYFLNDDEIRVPFVLFIPPSVWGRQPDDITTTLESMGYLARDINDKYTTNGVREIGWNVESIDLMPTLIDYAGLKMPSVFRHKGNSFMYGRSLKPLIELDPEVVPTWKEPVLSQIFVYSRAIRVGDWKLVWGLNRGDRFFRYNCDEFHLYDIRNDPGECINMVDEYPEKRDELIGILEEMMSSLERKRNFKRIPFDEYIKLGDEEDKKLVDTLIGLGYISDADLDSMFSSDWSNDEDDTGQSYVDEDCGCRGRDSEDISIDPWQLPDDDYADGI